MHVDDLLLLALSISDLHKLMTMCREEFLNCNLTLNNNKPVCLRIGPSHAADSISVIIGTDQFLFKKELKYTGCTILSGPSFACSLQDSKQKFFGSADGIFGKVGATPDSHQLILLLINGFGLPVLLYGFDAIGNKKSIVNSIDFIYNSVFVKIFGVKEVVNIRYCQFYTGSLPASCLLDLRLINFCARIKSDGSGFLASQLFCLLGDQYFIATLDKYNISPSVGLSRSVVLAKVWQRFEASIMNNLNAKLCCG